MQTVGPESFTVGASTPVPDPAQGGGNPSRACQIQNSSGYQLQVNAGGASLSIQPYWAQTVEISGQPITILPKAGSGSGPCSITLAFLLGTAPGNGTQLADGTWVESPPQDDGSLTAAAIAASTQGSVDFLGSGVVNLTGSTPATLGPFTAEHSYSTVLLIMTNPTTGVISAYAVDRGTVPFPSQSQETESGNVVPFLLLFAGAPGDSVEAVIESALTINNVAWSLYGLTELMTQQVIAPVGNPLPVVVRGGNSEFSLSVPASSSETLLNTAPAGFAYRLHRFSSPDVVGSAAAATPAGAAIVLSVTGSSVFLGVLSAAAPSISLDGQMVVSSVSAFNGFAGGACRVTLTYDIVPLQTIT